MELADDRVPDDLLQHHMDPFHAECRAYGRLVNRHLNGEVAVHCYGYMNLSIEQENEIAQKFGIYDWKRQPVNDNVHNTHPSHQPLHAIVKEFIADDAPFNNSMVKIMLSNLKTMRRHGIFPIDIREDNYRGGRLVDFSIAWTKPHLMLSAKLQDSDYIRKAENWDLASFDEMVKDMGIHTTFTASPNEKYCSKLRSRDPILHRRLVLESLKRQRDRV